MSTDAQTPAETLAPATAPLPAAPTDVSARNPLWATGRRKTATVRVRIFPGGGNFVVNGRGFDDYFRHEKHRLAATKPFDLIGARTKYDVRVNAQGGGPTGQADAMGLACARALERLEPAQSRVLRDAGLLTRDARKKERKKYGRRGARRGFQFSKR